MTIDFTKLVSSATLQDLLRDKDSTPLAAGVVTMYEDNSRTVLKNWYYQTGAPGNYTWLPLPNPMILSAAGTICDANGNDTIPFYYPYSESDNTTSQKYYVTVDNSGGERQFVRQNFPEVPTASQAPENVTSKNLIVNNRFYRNISSGSGASGASSPVDLSSQTQYFIAPSQHNGFIQPDVQFFKSTAGATETVTLQQFPLGSNFLQGDVQPEFYLEHNCTVAGTETYKYYQFPICEHIRNLDAQKATFTIQAINTGGGSFNQLSIGILQFTGSGTTSPALQTIGTITTTSAWKKYPIEFTFPTGSGATLSGTGDDAYYLQIALPAGQVCDLSFALPSIYLCTMEELPVNDFASYQEIEWQVNSPRTGDTKIGLNSFASYANFGWVPADDGTIGNVGSSATNRNNIDTWFLYNLLWNNVNNTYAPVTGGRGASAYADFTALKAIGLTAMLGRVIAGISNNSPHVLGFTEGSATFTLTTNELPAHTHGYTNYPTLGGSGMPTTPGGSFSIVPQPNGATTDSTGNGAAFSIMQPTVYYNVYFKL